MGAIYGLVLGVWSILGFGGFGVFKTLESLSEVVWHGKIDGVFIVAPREG